MHRPSLSQLQTLAEVAHTGSFLAAAKKLGLTQPL
jgi:DNA-binding transcriptional LysR family regulator